MRDYQAGNNKLRVIHEILVYLADHPYAQDTLEGITEWWLLEQEIKHQLSVVKEALAKLVESGLVIEKSRKSYAQASYCINPDKVQEVRELVKEASEGYIFEEGDGKA